MRTRFFRCQLPLMMVCGLLPVPILICCLFGSGILWPWMIAPAGYLLLSCLCMLLPGRWRLAAAIPGMIALFLGTYAAMAAENEVVRVLNPALFIVFQLFTLPIAGWERGREPPTVIPAVCICAHLFAQFFLFVKPTDIAAVPYLLMGSFLIFLLLMMLSLNRQSMANAMPEAHTVPVSIRRRNRLLTWILMGIVLLISTIPALGQIVAQVMEWLKIAILAIVKWFMALFETQSSSGESGGSTEELLAGLGTGETSTIAKILEKIMIGFAVILLAFIVLWVMRFLWRKLKQLVRYIYGQLRHYANAAGEDYVDEVEDTREQGEENFNLAQRILRRRNAQRSLKGLPPREQIRTRYGLMRGRHPEWERSATARETLNETSAKIYERARYSSHEVTAQDSETFADQQSR